jgi:hypothetical protein
MLASVDGTQARWFADLALSEASEVTLTNSFPPNTFEHHAAIIAEEAEASLDGIILFRPCLITYQLPRTNAVFQLFKEIDECRLLQSMPTRIHATSPTTPVYLQATKMKLVRDLYNTESYRFEFYVGSKYNFVLVSEGDTIELYTHHYTPLLLKSNICSSCDYLAFEKHSHLLQLAEINKELLQNPRLGYSPVSDAVILSDGLRRLEIDPALHFEDNADALMEWEKTLVFLHEMRELASKNIALYNESELGRFGITSLKL